MKQSIAETAFDAGKQWALDRALEVLDAMFMVHCSISVDDWFKGREEFIKRVEE